MIERLIELLNACEGLNGWLINDKKITSNEMFFVLDKLDMNRTKDVRKIMVKVYKDFEEDGTAYKGAASGKFSPAMDDHEVVQKIDALLLGKFCKKQAP